MPAPEFGCPVLPMMMTARRPVREAAKRRCMPQTPPPMIITPSFILLDARVMVSAGQLTTVSWCFPIFSIALIWPRVVFDACRAAHIDPVVRVCPVPAGDRKPAPAPPGHLRQVKASGFRGRSGSGDRREWRYTATVRGTSAAQEVGQPMKSACGGPVSSFLQRWRSNNRVGLYRGRSCGNRIAANAGVRIMTYRCPTTRPCRVIT